MHDAAFQPGIDFMLDPSGRAANLDRPRKVGLVDELVDHGAANAEFFHDPFDRQDAD